MVAKTGTQSHWERWLEMEGVLLENKEETVVIDTGSIVLEFPAEHVQACGVTPNGRTLFRIDPTTEPLVSSECIDTDPDSVLTERAFDNIGGPLAWGACDCQCDCTRCACDCTRCVCNPCGHGSPGEISERGPFRTAVYP